MAEERTTNMVTLISTTEKAKKYTRNLYLFVLSYFVITITSYYLNLGDSELLISFSDSLASIIPSINDTAAISRDYNYARLVLVLSWLFIAPAYVSQVINADWDNVRTENTNFLAVALTIFLVGYLWALFCRVPDNTGSYGSRIYNIIKSFTFGISIWGFLMWFLSSLLMSSLTILLVLRIKMLFGKR